jgi:hypothetical protein
VFPVGVGLTDLRFQKRDLGHPSVLPFDIAEGTSFVIALPTRLSDSVGGMELWPTQGKKTPRSSSQLFKEPLPFPCNPDRSVPGFPATQHLTRPRVRLFLKERRMMFANATNFYRKSGVAQCRDLRFSLGCRGIPQPAISNNRIYTTCMANRTGTLGMCNPPTV